MKTIRFFGVIIVLMLMLSALQVGNAAADDVITVRLQNSDGALLTGGALRYHDGTWHNAVDNGDGTFSVTTSASSITYEMTYNNGRQTLSNVPATTNPVTFTTVSTTVALKNFGGTALGGGTVRYHQITWVDFGDANTSDELLPGPYTFEMTFNNGRQTFSNYAVPAVAAHEVLFTTVSTTVALKDSSGTAQTGGTVRYHQITWANFGDANTELELLPGPYTFEMTFNNGRQTFSNYAVPADAAHEVLFTTVSTTVALKDSGDNTLSGGTVRFHQITWVNFGDANTEQELLPGKYTFEMTFNNGRQTFSNHTVPAAASHEVAFVTTTATARLATCGNTGLDGGAVRFHQITWADFGTTAGGDAIQELLPGNYTFEMTYNNGRQTFSNVAVSGAAQTVPFTTTAVTFDYAGAIQYHQITWATFNKPTMDLLPGNYTFKFDALTVSNVPVSGCAMGSGTLTVNFPGISSVHAYVRKTDGVPGAANGTLVKQLTYKNDAAVFTDVPNGVYDVVVVKGAQTKIVDNVILIGDKTVDNIVATMTVNFPGISTVHTYVKTTGGGSVDERTYKNDTVSLAVLKAAYKVTVVKGAQQNTYDVDCSAGDCTLDGIVATMTVNFPGVSTVHTYVKTTSGGSVDERTYKNDTTSLAVLKAAYKVTVVKGAKQNTYDVDCSAGDCVLEDIVSTLTVNFPGISSVHTYVKTDDGVAGFGGGSVDERTYKNDSTSLVLLKGFYDVKVVKGAQANVYESVDCTGLTCSIDNIVATFTLNFPGKTGVHTYIKTNDGIVNSATGGSVDERTYQNNSTTMALLKNYYDVVVKIGAETYILDNVDCTGNVCTYTLTVVKLLNSGGVGLPGGYAEYYSAGWKLIGTTPANGVLSFAMPGSPATYSFRMSYAGYTQQKSNVNIATTNPIVFQTLSAGVHFQDSLAAPLAGGGIEYYASGWKTFGSGSTDAAGNASMELLPGSYSFRMSWAGYTQQQSNVNIATTNPVLFQTLPMAVHFKDSANAPLANGGIEYYASGWKTFGSGLTDAAGNASMELLPGSYSFRMSWAGYTQQKSNVNIVTTNPLEFQTLSVYARLEQTTTNNGIPGGVAQYYASGWKPLGTTGADGNTPSVELLPGVYSFRMTYAGATEQKSNINITTTNPVVFQTVNEVMSVMLEDSDGDPIEGGVVRYYASGWKDFGTTDSSGLAIGPNLLLGIYSFQMTYGGYTQQKSNVNISLDDNKPLVYTTTDMLVTFEDSYGNPIEGGVVRYYASGWKDFGVTDENGEARLELLPGAYSFQMTYAGYTQQKSNINIETTNPLEFETVEMAVNFKDSGSNPIEGGVVRYYASGWKDFGTTDSNGTAKLQLLPGVYSFQMSWAGYTQQKSNVATSTSPLEFQTVEMEVKLETCNSTGLEGGAVRYYASGWKTFGTTDANGSASLELLPGAYSFQVTWAGQTEQRSNVDITATNPLTYNTTTVALQYPGTIQYYASGWKTFTSPMELLPYNYTFKFGSYQTQFDVTGCSLTKSVIILSLKDHAGIGLAGGTARGGYGSNYGTFFVPGSTASNGLLFVYQNGLQTTMSYEMRYNNTTQVKTQDVSSNAVFEFNTNLLTLRMETCGGAPLDGGNPRGGNGSTYTTWWFPGGVTGSSAPGETKAEFFPGTYSFEMLYKATADAKVSVTIPDADSLLTWQTTNVTLDYPGQISYGGGTGDSTFFNKPSMELLPGTYKFNFRPDNRLDLTLSGCSFNKAFVSLKVMDENGNGVPGGKATPAYGGSWGAALPGTTDANGKLFSEIPPGYTKIKMTVNQGAVEQSLAQLTASNYTWYTEVLRIWLNDHAGAAITDGSAALDQGGGYWYAWGNLNSSGYKDIQLFPGSYKFRVTYNYTGQDLFPVISVAPGIANFYFQTGQVFGSCITQYSAGAWRTFTDGMELMPGAYTFKEPSQSGTVTPGGITYLTCP